MYKAIVLSFISLSLIGCGGGGGGGGGAATTSTVPVETPAEAPVEVPAEEVGLDLYVDDLAVARAAADFSAASDQLLTGAGVTVGVFDTGILETHDEFVNITLSGDSGYYQTKFVVYPDTPLIDPTQFDSLYQSAVNDEDGHGSHVTSIIAGKNVGYATGVDIVMIDNSNTDSGNVHPWVFQDFLEELVVGGVSLFNVSQTSCLIRNSADISLAHYADSLAALDANNGLVVCGGGNDSANMTTELVTQTTNKFYHDANDSPWSSDAQMKDNFLHVGAVDASGALADFSNYPGADADLQSRWISAIGVGIVGATSIMGDSEYILMDGTSQAAPLVTSAAAIMKEKFPSLNFTQIAQALLDTADKTFTGYDATKHGQGILDVEAALAINPASY